MVKIYTQNKYSNRICTFSIFFHSQRPVFHFENYIMGPNSDIHRVYFQFFSTPPFLYGIDFHQSCEDSRKISKADVNFHFALVPERNLHHNFTFSVEPPRIKCIIFLQKYHFDSSSFCLPHR